VKVTKKQLNHMRKLFMERARNADAQEIRQCALALYKEDALTREAADEIIKTVELIPRDVMQKEVPSGVDPVPGFYRVNGTVYEVEKVLEGRFKGYVRVYELELIDLEEGGQAWERKRLTRTAMARVLEQIA